LTRRFSASLTRFSTQSSHTCTLSDGEHPPSPGLRVARRTSIVPPGPVRCAHLSTRHGWRGLRARSSRGRSHPRRQLDEYLDAGENPTSPRDRRPPCRVRVSWRRIAGQWVPMCRARIQALPPAALNIGPEASPCGTTPSTETALRARSPSAASWQDSDGDPRTGLHAEGRAARRYQPGGGRRSSANQ
jgi:hypothetical protein